MKLVDILARELKVWPEGVESLSQSFGEMVFYVSSEVQLKTMFRAEISEDWRESAVTRAQWQAAVDALKDEVHPTESMALHHQEVGRITRQWNGEGLPPVGTVCECHLPGELTNNYSWVEAKVIWHNGPTECAVVRSTSKLAWCDEFRPIRTPEQIAAEDRQRAIEDLGEWLSTNCSIPTPHLWEAAQKIYDAGYRKFEIVDN